MSRHLLSPAGQYPQSQRSIMSFTMGLVYNKIMFNIDLLHSTISQKGLSSGSIIPGLGFPASRPPGRPGS